MNMRALLAFLVMGIVFLLAEIAILQHYFPPPPRPELPAQGLLAVQQHAVGLDTPPFAWNRAHLPGLQQAFARQQAFLQKSAARKRQFPFADTSLTAERLRRSGRLLLEAMRTSRTEREFNEHIREDFVLYRPMQDGKPMPVRTTGYYTPYYQGSSVPTEQHRYPLYLVPSDLKVADLGEFSSALQGERIVYRIDEHREQIVPYYSRREIAEGGVLAGKDLELVFLDSILDCFLLMLEGSGKIQVDGKEYFVVWAADNGRMFRSVQQMLLADGHLSAAQLTRKGLARFFRAHPEAVSRYLYANEKYVFFERGEEGPRGVEDILLTGRHSVALDLDLFPPGIPVYLSAKNDVASPPEQLGLFGFCQDAGSAIRGPVRADLYFGVGEKAREMAESYRTHLSMHVLLAR